MKKFTGLIVLWVLVILSLVYFNFRITKYNLTFLGVAENNELNISFGDLVEVKEVLVVSGEEVTKGQKLLEVARPDLELRIRDYTDRLLELQAQELNSTLEIQSMISQLEGEIRAKEAEIMYEIRQLESQYNINRDLTRDLRSLASIETEFTLVNPTAVRIEALKEDLQLLTDPLKVRMDQLKKQLASSENPYKVQIENIEKELANLRMEREKLQIYSPGDGIVGMVNFKVGEIVAPYFPILSINSHTPSYVNGFIHESSYQEIEIHDKIEILGNEVKSKKIVGEVVGIGSKIAEYPERLRKNMDVRVWGREVQIRIPEENLFLQGEKVTLRKIN